MISNNRLDRLNGTPARKYKTTDNTMSAAPLYDSMVAASFIVMRRSPSAHHIGYAVEKRHTLSIRTNTGYRIRHCVEHYRPVHPRNNPRQLDDTRVEGIVRWYRHFYIDAGDHTAKNQTRIYSNGLGRLLIRNGICSRYAVFY